MLFTSYIYVQQKMTNKENHHQMAEGNPVKPKSPNKQLSDSDTSDEEPINLSRRKTLWDNTWLGISHTAVLSHSRAQANLTVERGPSHKVRVKKLPKEKATEKSTQTEKQKK